MDVIRLFRRLALAASILGIAESITFLVLSILGILTSQLIIRPEYGITYQAQLLFIMVNLYFPDDTLFHRNPDIMSPDGMLTYCCIYLFFNFFWLVSSIILAVYASGVIKNQIRDYLMTWGIICIVGCLLDFSTMIIFGLDYSLVSNSFSSPYTTQAVLNYLLIGAKGFALWLINLIFAIVILVFVIKKKSQMDQDRLINFSTSRSFTGPWAHSRDALWNSGPDSADSYHVPAVLSKGVDVAPAPATMINSPTVGDLPRSPWLFNNNRNSVPNQNNNTVPQRAQPVSAPPPPPLPSYKPVLRRYIPEPDYSPPVRRSYLGAFGQPNRNPINSGFQEEPPLRSALKKSHSHHGRTVF